MALLMLPSAFRWLVSDLCPRLSKSNKCRRHSSKISLYSPCLICSSRIICKNKTDIRMDRAKDKRTRTPVLRQVCACRSFYSQSLVKWLCHFGEGGREGTRTPDLLRVNNLAVLRLRLFRHSRRSNQPKIADFSTFSYPATQFRTTDVNSCVLQCRSVLHSIDQC